MADIVIAAALMVRENGDTLLVRKRGTTAFLQPGGKIEPEETAPEAPPSWISVNAPTHIPMAPLTVL